MNLPYEVQCTYPYGNNDSNGDTESEFLQKVKDKFNYSGEDYSWQEYMELVKNFRRNLVRFQTAPWSNSHLPYLSYKVNLCI